MNPNQQLHDLGQSLWLDNITRTLLDDGTLQRYVEELAVTGLTSNPTIFEKAIVGSDAYDTAIARSSTTDTQALFFELALSDLTRAADLFAPIHRRTGGADGWVSLEVSPMLAEDAAGTIDAAAALHQRAGRENLFIKIPGTGAGLAAIEESTFAGVPVNVTLLFSAGQTLAAAEAWVRGIERRIKAGRNPPVTSVLSLFVSRWDVAVQDKVTDDLRDRLGIAVARRTYRDYLALCRTPRWQELSERGVRPQRLLWASTGTKDPNAPDTLYVEALAAPNTINTLPEATLKAFADHGHLGGSMPYDGGDAEVTLARFKSAGIDIDALADQLQREGTVQFSTSWCQLLAGIEAKRKRVAGAERMGTGR
ncbi:MAG: transaldolase [Arenicellales bacterium]